MSTKEIAILFVTLVPIMVAWRCIPLFTLKGRELNPTAKRALELIPIGAFAALVANDLFATSALVPSLDMYQLLVPVLAALPVVVIARKTKSLIVCAIVGTVFYALISMALGQFVI